MRRARRAAIVLGGLFALAFLSGCGSAEPEGAFYLKVEIVVDPESNEVSPPPSVGMIREHWFRDERHYRTEVNQPPTIVAWTEWIHVGTGDEALSFSPRTARWSRDPLRAGAAPRSEAGFTSGDSVGKIRGPVDAFLDTFDGLKHVGTGEVLGRPVEVYEHERGTLYVDHEIGFVLRHTYVSGSQSVEERAVALDLDPAFEDELFEYEIPEAAIESSEPECHPERTSRGAPFPFPAGFIQFAYAPPGYQSQLHQGGGSNCGLLAFASVGDGDNYVRITEHLVPPTGAPDFVDGVEEIEIAGFDGYRQAEGDVERIGWVQKGIVIVIETNAAPLEDLLRIAESGEAVP